MLSQGPSSFSVLLVGLPYNPAVLPPRTAVQFLLLPIGPQEPGIMYTSASHSLTEVVLGEGGFVHLVQSC